MNNRKKPSDIIKKIIFVSLSLFLTSCVTVYVTRDTSVITKEQKEFYAKYDLKSYTSIFSNTSFSDGFRLPEARDSITHQHSNPRKYKYIDYNDETGITATAGKQQFTLSQWWRPDVYDILQNATYTHIDNNYEWKNDARSIKVDKSTGALTLQIDSSKEFAARKDEPDYVDWQMQELKEQSDGSIDKWPHFLLEGSAQSDIASYYHLSDYESVYVDFKFTVNESNYTGKRTEEERKANPTSYKYAGQIFFYVCLYNVPDVSNPAVPSKGIWVGIPLYDTRYNNYQRSVSMDVGFTGATNRVIYKCAQNDANPAVSDSKGVELGKKYTIHYNMMPLIKEAYKFAAEIDPNGQFGAASFEGMPWNDIRLNYFNFGFELPGTFNMSATISDFDIYYK